MKQNRNTVREHDGLRVIGVTGGVGAGKSTVLDYLKEKYGAKIYLADEVAKQLLLPGEDCYNQVRVLFPDEVFHANGDIHREKMAALIFQHPEYRLKQNEIVFPAVRNYMEEQIEKEWQMGTKIMVIEAALLIEEHYDEICNEMWYIYTDESVRRQRLASSRGYSQEKITAIMNSQLSEKEFRENTQVTIDNSFSPEQTYKSVDEAIKNPI